MDWLEEILDWFSPVKGAPVLPTPMNPASPPPPPHVDLVSDEALRITMPLCPRARRALYLPHLNATLREFKIDTPVRIAVFLAQVAHETMQLRYVEEVWGPTKDQLRYDPPDELAAKLGNTEKGDGFRYKGRGAFQCTGKGNYRRYGLALAVDLEGHPELAGDPSNTFRIAGVYWRDHGLSTLADAGNFREVTRRINGGFNGEADREIYWQRAKSALSVS